MQFDSYSQKPTMAGEASVARDIACLKEQVAKLQEDITRLCPQTEPEIDPTVWLYSDESPFSWEPRDDRLSMFVCPKDESMEELSDRIQLCHGQHPSDTSLGTGIYLGGIGAPIAWREQYFVPLTDIQGIPIYFPAVQPIQPTPTTLELDTRALKLATSVIVVLWSYDTYNYRGIAELCYAIGTGHPRIHVVCPVDLKPECYDERKSLTMYIGDEEIHTLREVQIAVHVFFSTLLNLYMKSRESRQRVCFTTIESLVSYIQKNAGTATTPLEPHMIIDESMREEWLEIALNKTKRYGSIDVIHLLQSAYEMGMPQTAASRGRFHRVCDAMARISAAAAENIHARELSEAIHVLGQGYTV